MARRSSGVSSTFAAPRVFFKAMQPGCARNRNDPRLLGKQPNKRELSRCCLLLLREFAEQIRVPPSIGRDAESMAAWHARPWLLVNAFQQSGYDWRRILFRPKQPLAEL
jgi:hypothetical protein